MLPILTLFCLVAVPYLTAGDEAFCSEMMKGFEPCEKGLLKKYCPFTYQQECEKKSGEEDGPPPKDDPEVCPKWKKQGKKGYCDPSNTELMMAYCPATYGKDCMNGEGGGGGGGSGKKETKSKPSPKPKPKPKNKPKPSPKPKPTPAPTTTAAETTTAQTTTKKSDKTAEEQYHDCCKANGVSSDCMKMCTFDNSKRSKSLCKPSEACEQYAEAAHYCMNNGDDHTKCCKDKGLDSHCLTWCNAKKPLEVDFSNLSDLMKQQSCIKSTVGQDCAKSEYSGTQEWTNKNFGKGPKLPAIASGFVAKSDNCK